LRNYLGLVLLVFVIVIFPAAAHPAGADPVPEPDFLNPDGFLSPDILLSPGSLDPSPELELWLDEHSDLWVETPDYRWNISGGTQISARIGERYEPWVSPDGLPGGTLVEALFLSGPGGTGAQAKPLKAQLVYQLSDQAMVYVTRPAQDGVEGLALTFSAHDSLITIAHHWQGASAAAPVFTELTELPAVELLSLDQSGRLEEAVYGLRPQGFEVHFQYDPASDRGVALLLGRSSAPGIATAPAPLRATGSVSAAEGAPSVITPIDCEPGSAGMDLPGAAEHCFFSQNLPPGLFLGRQYLYLFSAGPDPVEARLENLSERLQLALPDLNAAWISRTPRYDYDQPKNQPEAGDRVVFTARVANRGGQESGPFNYVWTIDGAPVHQGWHSGLPPGEAVGIELPWIWTPIPHTIGIILDPEGLLEEVSKSNNRVADRSDGLALGLWVEQSVYDWFNLKQVGLGLGSVSWEDWAQRQVRVWNQALAEAITPLTPQGVLDRVRLDKVTVVPDGSLPGPYPANYPASEDRSVDLQWGFPAGLVVEDPESPGRMPYYLSFPEAVYVEFSLLHELGHARYLDDLYGLNVVADPAVLAENVGPGDTVLEVRQVVEGYAPFSLPAYLALGGELIVCDGSSKNVFFDCRRGVEGTTPRPHLAGSRLNRAAVRLQDGRGSLVMGSPALPLIGWDDHLYFNRYPADIMSGGKIYEAHSAYALNRIAGHRPVCGNYNVPCNVGEYQNDIPAQNYLLVRGDEAPLAGAVVEIYRARPFEPTWYGKTFSGPPHAMGVTGQDGLFELGPFPFSDTTAEANTYNRVFLVKVTYEGQASYHFLDITHFNEMYWTGRTEVGYYPVSGE
jgi:hypothetical protein